MREGQSLVVNGSDRFKVEKVVTNIEDVGNVEFAMLELPADLLLNAAGEHAVEALVQLSVRHATPVRGSLDRYVRHFNKEGLAFSNELKVDSPGTRILSQVSCVASTTDEVPDHGFSDGTNERAIMHNAEQGVSNNLRQSVINASILIVDPTSDAILVQGNITLNVDDVTIVWTVRTVDFRIIVEIWGGADGGAVVGDVGADASPLTGLGLANGHYRRSNDRTESPDINYEVDYLVGVRELRRAVRACRKSLPQVTAPALIIQAEGDPLVGPKSATVLERRLGSRVKMLSRLESDRHVIVRGDGSEGVFDAIAEFIREQVVDADHTVREVESDLTRGL
ncbi:MAG: alpha/beta hydrolase [Planctomycetes bacterium]|nr:alpha/beta hydrolase [Planctomycetota bacterium]